MNRTLLAAFSFVAAFTVGSVPSTWTARNCLTKVGPCTPPSQVAELNTARLHAAEPKPDIEFQDVPELDEFIHRELSDRLIHIFETDGIYRKSEVIAKSGERWLVFGRRRGRYSLRSSTATVIDKRTISYPGDEHDVELSFPNVGTPIFAVRSIPALRPGPVTTIYHRPSRNEIERRNLPIDPMKKGYEREFNVGKEWYKLRVAQGTTRKGTSVSVLVLEHDGTVQILAQNYAEIIGELLWVGDLDNDGKLDLYFDEFNEKGYFGVGLYLSSAAADGELVQLVATFGMAGC